MLTTKRAIYRREAGVLTETIKPEDYKALDLLFSSLTKKDAEAVQAATDEETNESIYPKKVLLEFRVNSSDLDSSELVLYRDNGYRVDNMLSKLYKNNITNFCGLLSLFAKIFNVSIVLVLANHMLAENERLKMYKENISIVYGKAPTINEMDTDN